LRCKEREDGEDKLSQELSWDQDKTREGRKKEGKGGTERDKNKVRET